MNPLVEDISHLGDLGAECALSLDESFAWCRRLARRTAGNFYF